MYICNYSDPRTRTHGVPTARTFYGGLPFHHRPLGKYYPRILSDYIVLNMFIICGGEGENRHTRLHYYTYFIIIAVIDRRCLL